MFCNNRLDFQECLKDKLSNVSMKIGLLLKLHKVLPGSSLLTVYMYFMRPILTMTKSYMTKHIMLCFTKNLRKFSIIQHFNNRHYKKNFQRKNKAGFLIQVLQNHNVIRNSTIFARSLKTISNQFFLNITPVSSTSHCKICEKYPFP